MRVIVLSDIHANLVALEAVLLHASAGGEIDAVWCLGDTVGYGPQPEECIRVLREMDAVWVAGNHERAATGAIGVEEFNPDAAAAALWTMERLPAGDCRILDALPEVLTPDDCTLVHGTLRWPIWEYLGSQETALGHLRLQETSLGFVGHTHVPLVAVLDPDRVDECEMYRLAEGAVVRITGEGKVVVNPGSVGQPRDGDPRASYAVYDTGERTITLNRVDYAVNATQRLMMDAGLPRWLIERLSAGR
jgi:diadenosine tetraphosphatase ApaH/serine/threonine PP2A family protein phosphatase